MQMIEPWRHEPTMRLGASIKATAKNGAKLRGQRYHRKIYDKLQLMLGAEADLELLIEPWFRNLKKPTFRQPDAAIVLPSINAAIVIEVKLNWKDGRDVKLIDEYLPIVKTALGLDVTWPLLITQCLRGYPHPPLLGLKKWEDAMSWQPGDPTPLMLVP